MLEGVGYSKVEAWARQIRAADQGRAVEKIDSSAGREEAIESA
jgi:hypothetical protein